MGLGDFSLHRDMVSPSNMATIDRYILHQLWIFCHEADRRYEEFSFSKVVSEMIRITNDVLAFYFDTIKDRLYTELTNTPTRRAAQTVLLSALRCLVKCSAPILPHLAEDLYEHTSEDIKYYISDGYHNVKNIKVADNSDFDSIFTCGGLLPCPSNWKSTTANKAGLTIRDIRNAIMKATVVSRDRLEIKNSTELSITISSPLDSQTSKHLTTFTNDELNYSFGVAATTLTTEDLTTSKNDCVTNVSIGSDMVVILLRRSKTYKCRRCWLYTSMSEDSLCSRCETVMHKQLSVETMKTNVLKVSAVH